MNKITKEDIDLLYWHAVSKMRQGSFKGAYQFFSYVYDLEPIFRHGLAMAYSAYRNEDYDSAQWALSQIKPETPRDQRFYERLIKRVGA